MPRFFNTAGPVAAAKHYCIPPLERLDLRDVLDLIRTERYFVLHAPRQTGKTSALLALRDLLNGGGEGDYRCVYVNVEPAQAMREDVEAAMRAILGELASRARTTSGDGFLDAAWPGILAKHGPAGALREALSRWSEAAAQPLVLLVDEIDALVGDTLLSVLRQLRAGYDLRPAGFPQSVVLCGVRDVRDYRIRSSAEQAVIAGGSAFNVKARSLRLGDFSRDDVTALLAQHTGETRQAFEPAALEAIWERTRGQPWLVNALADETCFRDESGRNRSRAITTDDVCDAQERIIQRRETHLDQLADKLQEDRVRRVVEPLLSGGDGTRFLRPRHRVRPRPGAGRQRSAITHRQSLLRGSGAARADRGCPGGAGPGADVVRRCRRRAGRRQAARRLPDLLPRARRALGRALRLPGGRARSFSCRHFSSAS